MLTLAQVQAQALKARLEIRAGEAALAQLHATLAAWVPLMAEHFAVDESVILPADGTPKPGH